MFISLTETESYWQRTYFLFFFVRKQHKTVLSLTDIWFILYKPKSNSIQIIIFITPSYQQSQHFKDMYLLFCNFHSQMVDSGYLMCGVQIYICVMAYKYLHIVTLVQLKLCVWRTTQTHNIAMWSFFPVRLLNIPSRFEAKT